MALLIAAKLEQKRKLIVTHNTMLRDQWITDVRRLFNIEPGAITAGKFDIEDHCIVIANVQTLTKHALTVFQRVQYINIRRSAPLSSRYIC